MNRTALRWSGYIAFAVAFALPNMARRMFGEAEILVAAKHLTGMTGIEIDDSHQPLEYFHLLFDRHEIVCSEGAQTESLFTGPEALRSVDPSARAEIMALFPELLATDRAWEPARRLGEGRRGRQLAKRHAENQRELLKALLATGKPVVLVLFAAGFLLNLLYGVVGAFGGLLSLLGGVAAMLALLDGCYGEAAASAAVAFLISPIALPQLLMWVGNLLICAASALYTYLYRL